MNNAIKLMEQIKKENLQKNEENNKNTKTKLS
jgi:hypothetical protein